MSPVTSVLSFARELAMICNQVAQTIVMVLLAIWLWHEKAKPWLDKQRADSAPLEDESAQGESIVPREGWRREDKDLL